MAMSTRDFQATASQLLHRQSSSQQHLRQYTFAATIADRFFSDNSLDRQKRVVECARRRQARARDRALQQAYRVEQLENELAEAERIRVLKEEREASRMKRKLQHVAAAYIQYIWRRYCQLRREAAYRRAQAERLIVDFVSYRKLRRKTIQHRASFRIQRRWREHRVQHKIKVGLAVLTSFIVPLIRKRRRRAQHCALKVQHWYRQLRIHKREKAARIIQHAWRLTVSKAKIRYFSRAFKHLTNLKRLERSARVVQRALGIRNIQRRLLLLPEFEEYSSVMVASWPVLRAPEERVKEFWKYEKRALEDAIAERKRLEKEETSLQSELESLQQRLVEANSRRNEESERLRRHSSLEENRRLKDEENKQKRLEEQEGAIRRAIRLELEQDLESARRLRLRAKGSKFSVAICNDEEELLDALAGLQAAESVDGISAQFVVVREALIDIHRKRWRFLEDSCAVALRQVFGLVSSDDNTIIDSVREVISTTQAITLCLQLIEPLIHTSMSIADALENQQEATNQRAVLVASLLHLFAKIPLRVSVHEILTTLRFREELIDCRRALLPSFESDSESELDSDDDEILGESTDFKLQDTQWIGDKVAHVWGLNKYQYFMQTSGQEYLFASWSYRGIGNFVHELLTNEQHGAKVLSPVVSPFSWLFHIAAYSHYMIQAEDHQERLCGLQLLQVGVGLCPQGKLSLPVDRGDKILSDQPLSFREQTTSFRDRDWVSPLIQVITNAMVSFHEANDRSATLSVLKELISKIEIDNRFWLLKSLTMKCPYGNVKAVLVDFVRGDAVRVWSSTEVTQQSSFKTTAICSLLQETLSQAAERDLVLYADLIASCLSLLRFLYIRDKDNETGVRTKTSDCSVWNVLARINQRLQVQIEETTLRQGGQVDSHSSQDGIMHLVILEAALGSTLEICS